MGCSSSAQTQVKDGSRPPSKSPDANGLQKCEGNVPITKENDAILDQTKLVPIKEVELECHGTHLSEGFAKEEADVLIPGITSCTLSTCQRVDPEGTEPQPVTLEEKLDSTGPLSPLLLEAGEPLPVGPPKEVALEPPDAKEAADSLVPQTEHGSKPGSPESSQEPSKEVALEPPDAKEPADSLVPQTEHGSKPGSPESSQQGSPEPVAEESTDPVTEIVKELQVGEEEQQTEGNTCLLTNTKGETGEKMETEMHHEIVSEGSETKEEETGEAAAAAATTEDIETTNNEE